MKRTTKKAAGRKTKKAKKAKASKVIVAKTARAAKPRKAPANGRAARLTADTVFSFVTTDGAAEEGRERAVLNAIKKIESGTAAQVGKAISSKDYKERDGAKWPASHPNVAGRILRDYLKIGNVRVVPAAN